MENGKLNVPSVRQVHMTVPREGHSWATDANPARKASSVLALAMKCAQTALKPAESGKASAAHAHQAHTMRSLVPRTRMSTARHALRANLAQESATWPAQIASLPVESGMQSVLSALIQRLTKRQGAHSSARDVRRVQRGSGVPV